MDFIYYKKTKNGFIILKYQDVVTRYQFYNFKDALKDFKLKNNLRYKRNIKLINDNNCFTYGFMYD